MLGWRAGSLTSLAPIIEERHISAGKKVFKAGAQGGDLIFIRRGTVRVELALEKKKDVWHIGTFRRGDFIGEMGFLDSARRSADAIALDDTDCYVLSRASFDERSRELSAASTDIFEGIACVLAMRLRVMNKELRALRS